MRTARIQAAARAAKIDRVMHYRWLRDDPLYRAAFEEAHEQAAQTLEDEAVRRAHDGCLEPLVYQGKFSYKLRKVKGTGPGTGKKQEWEQYGPPLGILKYSDALMMFLLRGFRPAKYRERSAVEVSGVDGAPIALDPRDSRLAQLTDEELGQLVAVAQKLTNETP